MSHKSRTLWHETEYAEGKVYLCLNQWRASVLSLRAILMSCGHFSRPLLILYNLLFTTWGVLFGAEWPVLLASPTFFGLHGQFKEALPGQCFWLGGPQFAHHWLKLFNRIFAQGDFKEVLFFCYCKLWAVLAGNRRASNIHGTFRKCDFTSKQSNPVFHYRCTCITTYFMKWNVSSKVLQKKTMFLPST